MTKLQTFTINLNLECHPDKSTLSLRSVQSILHHCPDIHRISLDIVDFGAHTLPRVKKQFGNAITLQLHEPILRWSDVLPVARFLSDLCSVPPNLLRCNGEKWIMVANLVREFHRVRADERKVVLNSMV